MIRITSYNVCYTKLLRAAIVSRELGIAAVVGTGHGTTELKDGQEVTLSCAEGEVGKIYQGKLAFNAEELCLDELPQIRTRIMMNIASPAAAFRSYNFV